MSANVDSLCLQIESSSMFPLSLRSVRTVHLSQLSELTESRLYSSSVGVLTHLAYSSTVPFQSFDSSSFTILHMDFEVLPHSVAVCERHILFVKSFRTASTISNANTNISIWNKQSQQSHYEDQLLIHARHFDILNMNNLEFIECQ